MTAAALLVVHLALVAPQQAAPGPPALAAGSGKPL